MSETKFWPGVEAAMDLDAVLLRFVIVLVAFATLCVLVLYANAYQEETGGRSLTVSDLRRFRSLSILEKLFAMLVVTVVLGITGAVATMTVILLSR